MSKGITDLGGIGRLLAEIRKLWLGWLRFRSEYEIRKLREDEQALKNQQLKLKNQDLEIKNKVAALRLIQSLFAASKKYGCSPEELQGTITLLASTQQIPTANEVGSEVLSNVSPKLLGEPREGRRVRR